MLLEQKPPIDGNGAWSENKEEGMNDNDNGIQEMLLERQETHGRFDVVSDFIFDIAEQARCRKVPRPVWFALIMIAAKMARILFGNWRHVDHWQDIIGYATLAMDFLEEKERDI